VRPADLRRLINSPRILLATVIVLMTVVTLWVGRQAWAVHQLTRGVGDTWFLDASGAQWFRLDEQRQDVSIDQISPYLQQAFVAVEDHRFFLHPGVDPIGLARALWTNVDGGAQQGGSTLTQQLARTLFLSNQKSYVRKAREALLSVLMESQLTKPQFLELYLNRIYLSAGVYGVEAMAQRLFD
jgi:membrane peptidoglycan carboxypeptidase